MQNGRLETGKEIKVKIPVNYHIKLHTLKVLKGQSISDTVEIALEKYFQTHPWPEGALRAATGNVLTIEATAP